MKKFIKIVALAVCLTLVEPAITPSIGVETVEAATKKVKINITQKTISEGQSIKLKIVGTKKKVKWSSSNKKIATVTTKGVVKGIDGGNNKKQSLLDQKNQMVDAAQSQLDSLLAYGGYYYGTEYDYQRELSSANQEVLKYQKIVAALEGDDSPEGQSRLRKAKSSLIDAQNTVNDLNERWGRKVQIETLKNVIKSSESNYQTKLTEIEQKHQQNLTAIRESE